MDLVRATWNARQRQGVALDIGTYNALIQACGTGPDQLRLALELFEDMQRQGLRPNIITYNALIMVCVRCREPLRAELLFERMQCLGVAPITFTFNALIVAWTSTRPQHALAFFEAMQLLGVVPDCHSFRIACSACQRCRHPLSIERGLDMVCEVYEYFEAMHRQGVFGVDSRDDVIIACHGALFRRAHRFRIVCRLTPQSLPGH